MRIFKIPITILLLFLVFTPVVFSYQACNSDELTKAYNLNLSVSQNCDYEVNQNQSIQTVINQAGPNQTICIKSGIYNERVVISTDNLTVRNHPDNPPEKPATIDGRYNLPSTEKVWNNNGLVIIRANNITFSGLNIINSRGTGIHIGKEENKKDIRLTNNRVLNNTIMHTRSKGLTVQPSDDTLVYGNILEHNSVRNLPPIGNYIHPAGAQMNAQGTKKVKFINNVTRYGGSEGIVIGGNQQNIDSIVACNVSHDNNAADVYLVGSKRAKVESNLVFRSNLNPYFQDKTPLCFSFRGIEKNNAQRGSTVAGDFSASNNIFWGCSNGIKITAGADDTTFSGVTASHNTIVSQAHSFSSEGGYLGIKLNASRPGSKLADVEIKNNIFYVYGVFDYNAASITENISATFSNNLWSTTKGVPNNPPASDIKLMGQDGQGKFEIIPKSQLPSSEVEYTQLYQKTRTWFKLQSNSPAINASTSSDEKFDHWGSSRDNQPDIGAHEFGSAPTSVKWNLNKDDSINIFDFPHILVGFISDYSFPDLSLFSSTLN